MDNRLLEILVCPLCKGKLEYDRAAQELICHADKLAYPIRDGIPVMLTVDLQIRFLNAAKETDLIGEGWVVRRGRSVSFCQAEVRRAVDDEVVAEGWAVYKVSAPKPPVSRSVTRSRARG